MSMESGTGTRLLRTLPWRAIVLVAVVIASAGVLLRLDIGRIVAAIGGLNLYWGLAGLLAYVAAQLAFAARWWLLIDPIARPAPTTILRYSLVGAMLNAVLPLRGGDVARALLVSRGHAIPLGDAGGVVAAERIGDALTVALLGAWLASHFVLPSGTVASLIALPTLVAVALTGLVIGMRTGLINVLTRRLPPRLGVRMTNGIDGLKSATQRMLDIRLLVLAGIAHAAGWAAVLTALASFLVGLSINVPGVNAALGILVMTSLGGMLVQVPAGLGTWHMLAVGALTLWGIPVETGIAYAIVAHAAGIVVAVVGGLLATLGSTLARDVMKFLRKA